MSHTQLYSIWSIKVYLIVLSRKIFTDYKKIILYKNLHRYVKLTDADIYTPIRVL